MNDWSFIFVARGGGGINNKILHSEEKMTIRLQTDFNLTKMLKVSLCVDK